MCPFKNNYCACILCNKSKILTAKVHVHNLISNVYTLRFDFHFITLSLSLSLSLSLQIKSNFFSMLSEASKLTPHSQWRKVKGIFQRDSRYQAVDSSSQREDYFEEYIKQLGKVNRMG